MNTATLRASGLAIGYRQGARGQTVVASGLELELHRGEVVCLVGPNGAGKSTLLRTLTGLQPALEGEITIDGIGIHKLDLKEKARKIGVVLTERVNVGMLPAYDLVALGRHPHTDWSGRLSETDREVVAWALAAVGAAALADRFVNELSDGERQKIMIARALAQEPAIIVLDEPTAFLDLPRRVETMGLLKRLARDTDRAILLSTHDLDLAIRAADRLWLMEAGGRIHIGAPEDLVLEGSLEAVFAGEGVVFDREHGSFHLAAQVLGRVRIEGVGSTAAWTERALRREGYEATDDGAEGDFTVAVRNGESSPSWRLERADRTVECGSISELIAAVRKS